MNKQVALLHVCNPAHGRVDNETYKTRLYGLDKRRFVLTSRSTNVVSTFFVRTKVTVTMEDTDIQIVEEERNRKITKQSERKKP